MDGFLRGITPDTQKIVGFSHAFIIADELCDLEARSVSIRQVAIDLEGDVDSINVAKSLEKCCTFFEVILQRTNTKQLALDYWGMIVVAIVSTLTLGKNARLP